jgi:tetratricopeptide (TPR) repeat protein
VSGSRAKAGLAAAALAAVLAAAVVPAWRAAAGKRRLREGEDLLLAAARQNDLAARATLLRDAEEVLDSAAERLPHDPRPPYLLGSAALLRGDFTSALDRYRRSLAIEERPETDLNLSRAHTAAGEAEAAAADALRAVWLAPFMLRDLPSAVRDPIRQELQRREHLLLLGQPGAVPPLGEETTTSAR